MRLCRPTFSATLAATGLAIALGCTTLPVLAGNGHGHGNADASASPAAPQARQQAADHTQALLALHKRWARAQGAEKSRALQQMVAKAEERRAFLLGLMATDPAEVLRVAIPEHKQTGMPTEVVEKLEQKLEAQGDFTSFYEDFPDGRHRVRHFLQTPFNERLEVTFAQEHPAAHLQGPAMIGGWLLGDGSDEAPLTLVSNDSASINWLDAGGSNTTLDNSITPSLAHTIGEQRTLLLLVNFTDKPEQPWSPSQAQAQVFGTVNDYIVENSSGRTWLSGDVAGWYTLPLESTVCDSYTLRNRARDAATADGFDLAQYQRFIFAFPKNACGYAGSAQVGGLPTDTFINDKLDLHNVAHELSHNLGLEHARARDCGTQVLGSNCYDIIYGDTLDVLGFQQGEGHLNPFHKERLGWFDTSEIREVSASGSLDLVPYADTSVAGTKALKIAKPDEPGSWYYVEFRQPVGFDAMLLDGTKVDVDNVSNGVIVRTAGTATNYSRLLDMTPASSNISVYDWQDPALESGLQFVDSSTGITLSTSWVSAQGATVDVQYAGNTSCVSAAPTVQVLAPISQWGQAGLQRTYNVNVTNQDSAACTARSFNLQSSQPAGWATHFNYAAPSLAPGQTLSTTVDVTPGNSAPDGFYDLAISTAQAPDNSSSLTYVVETPVGNAAPVAVDDIVQLSSIEPVVIPVLLNDSDPDGDHLSVLSFEQGSKGTVSLNSDGNLLYQPAKSFKSADQFSYSITDGQDTATATVDISLQSNGSTPGGGKGGGKGNK